jgi:tight adherence protein C
MSFLADNQVIAGLLAIIAGLFAYAVFVPRSSEKFSLTVDENSDNTKLLNLLSRLGGELYSTLPENSIKKKKDYPRIEDLLVRSGNPWNLNAEEFFFIRFVTAFMGFIIGWAVYLFLSVTVALPLILVVGGSTILGFMIPKLKYQDQAKKRDLDFKRQLPEALDLIIISLSGGNTFTQALREALPNMQDGVLKKELATILSNIDTGRTLSESLTKFGERAPNESIKTFVTAVKEATDLNVPLVEVLQSRAEASRQEFFALIHAKTAQLSSKMMGILTPTLIPALLIIVLTPALASLLNTLG